MKTPKTVAIGLGLLLLTAAVAHAGEGPSTGGGGFVVDCPATPLDQARVELLDLYEGRQIPDFVMAKASGNITEDYYDGVNRTYTAQGTLTLRQASASRLFRISKISFSAQDLSTRRALCL